MFMQWDDSLLIGYRLMDDTHREFVEVVNCLTEAADSELFDQLEQFRLHAEAHFGMEDQWMRETGFPPRDCHIEEHAAVLKSLHEVQELVARGNVAIARDFAAELIRWFPGHAIHLDSALSHWMVKRSTGGKPLVFRRNVIKE
jgi:hemerythrin-like metal-binding protein